MLIYLVGQDKKGEDGEEGAIISPNAAPSGQIQSDSDVEQEIYNPSGLPVECSWNRQVQEERECTFTRFVTVFLPFVQGHDCSIHRVFTQHNYVT